ncbi:MAG: DUF2974 domain-containing protein [Faecousia sp.]
MANIFDYLKWRGDLSFTQDPPNPVDALIFSALSYIPYTGRAADASDIPIPLREVAEDFLALEDYESRVRSKYDPELLRAAACTVRFGTCKVVFYRDQFIPEQETQFAAVTFLLPDDSAFAAFRGTDRSLVGWKEDFNMTFQQAIPAQLLAQEYVREVAAEYVMPLRLCGHSKGGNLAVFAAARSSPMVQQQILEVYNNDGPGFTDYLMGDPGYQNMVPRIKTYVPQSSVIGMLLEHEESYTIIKSNQVSLLQHDLYSWEVMGADFVPMEAITADSQFLNQTIKAWIAAMDTQERNRLVDAMFGLLGTGGIEKALDIFHPRNIRTYIKTLGNDPDTRRILASEFQNLMEAAKKTRAQLGEAKLPELPGEK